MVDWERTPIETRVKNQLNKKQINSARVYDYTKMTKI